MASAFIVDNLRSPFALAKKGELAGVRPDDLTAGVVSALVERSGVDSELVEDVILGCAFPAGEQGFNFARCVVLFAGLPQSVGGSTVNRWCDVLEGGVNASLGLDRHRKSLSFLLLAATVRLDAALLARLVDPTSVGPAAE